MQLAGRANVAVGHERWVEAREAGSAVSPGLVRKTSLQRKREGEVNPVRLRANARHRLRELSCRIALPAQTARTALAMIFKLAEPAEKCWRRLDGHNQLPKVILGVISPTEARFSDRKLKPLPPAPSFTKIRR